MRKNILNKIEKLFEPEMILEYFSFLNEDSSFVVEDNYKLIENLGYFQNMNPDWSVYFSQLAPFFETGMLFKGQLLQSMFYHGQTHDCHEAQMKVQLPTTTAFNIYRTEAQAFLKKLKLDTFFDTAKMQCHFVRIDSQLSFVLFSQKAELWNKLLLESFQKSLINYSL